MPYRRRRVRPRVAVTASNCTMTAKRRCAACNQHLQPGDPATRLRLKKMFQSPCGTCGHKPGKVKYFHMACAPQDINKAMGFDPQAHASSPHIPPPTQGAPVAPPPKPPSVEDTEMAAILALESALLTKVRMKKVALTPELQAKFKTFQGIKARVLRPGTPAEGETATAIALKRIIDLVFA